MLQVFLAANAKKEGVVTLGSDLQYKVLKSGAKDAPSPDEDTPCDCHYTGTLITGETFDSSIPRGEPTKFAPNQVQHLSHTLVVLTPLGTLSPARLRAPHLLPSGLCARVYAQHTHD